MTEPVLTPQIDDQFVIVAVTGDTAVTVGQIGAVKAGVLTPAAAGDTALVALGRVDRIRDGQVWIRRGVFGWRNSTGNKKVGTEHLGKRCYLAGPDTVQDTASGNAPAGIVVGVDGDRVWVDMRGNHG